MQINIMNYKDYLKQLHKKADYVSKDQKKELIKAYLEVFLFLTLHQSIDKSKTDVLFKYLRQLAGMYQINNCKINECEALVYLMHHDYQKAYTCYRKMAEGGNLDNESSTRVAVNRMLALYGTNENAIRLLEKRWLELSEEVENSACKEIINNNLRVLRRSKHVQ